MRHRSFFTVALALVSLALIVSPEASLAQDWPGFRGPAGLGVTDAKNLPVEWSKDANLVWKSKLPGPGASSPIVVGDRVFLTCWSGYADGEKNDPGELKNLKRHMICLNRKDGKILWQEIVPARLPETPWGMPMRQHGYSTGTPVSDGKKVYFFLGKSGVYAFDFAGKKLWHTEVGDYTNAFGSGSSPILWKNLVIVNAVVEGGRLLGLDKDTGKIIWKKKLWDDCWTTPILVSTGDKKEELVLMTPGFLRGVDPATGKELWKCECPEPSYVSANPVADNGIVYVMGSGNLGKVFIAVRAGGTGDVTKTHIVWKQKVGESYSSPIQFGPYIYFFSNLAYCLRASDGEIVFQERLPGLGREYSSPVAADGKIYLFTRKGNGLVIAAKNRLEVLGNNTLGEGDSFVASPAIAGNQIFVRSNDYLYCIGKK